MRRDEFRAARSALLFVVAFLLAQGIVDALESPPPVTTTTESTSQ